MKKTKITLQKIVIILVSIVAIVSVNIPNVYAGLSLDEIISKGSKFLDARK